MQTITKKIKIALDVHQIYDPNDTPFVTCWQVEEETPIPPKAKQATRHFLEIEVSTNIDMPQLRVSV